MNSIAKAKFNTYLGKFLDFGPWAVSAALSVGIFPYVLKLITTQPKELRTFLTFIWAKILAVDKSCQAELVKDNGHVYFINVLSDTDVDSTQKVYSAFILSCLVDNFTIGQESAKQNYLIATCTNLFTIKNSKDYKNPLLRQWCCICLGLCWQRYAEARWEGVRNNAHQYLIELISDPVPEVRTAAIFALGTYIGCGQGNEATLEQTNKLDSEIVNALIKDYDMVPIVRKELLVALFNYVNQSLIANQLNVSISNLNDGDNVSLVSSPSVVTLQQQQDNNSTSTPTLEGTPTFLLKSMSTSVLAKSPIVVNSASFQAANEKPQQTSKVNLVINGAMTTPSLTTSKSMMSEIAKISSTISSSKVKSHFHLSTPVNNLFGRVWSLLIEMQNDPCPDVAELADKVIFFHYLIKKICIFFNRIKRNFNFNFSIREIWRISFLFYRNYALVNYVWYWVLKDFRGQNRIDT